MFEKCEQATANPDILLKNRNEQENESTSSNQRNTKHNNNNNEKSMTNPKHDKKSLDQDIKHFIKENEHVLFDQNLNNLLNSSQNEQIIQINSALDQMVLFCLNNLKFLKLVQLIFVNLKMLNAILVLRIHLLEMEKVNELCTDFADRYIETLRLKLNSDNIFKNDDELNDDLNEDNTNSNETKNDTDSISIKKEKNKLDDSSEPKSSKKKNKKLKLNTNLTSTPIKKESLAPYEISSDTSLSKIKFNMLNINNSITNNTSDSANHSLISNESDLEDNYERNNESYEEIGEQNDMDEMDNYYDVDANVDNDENNEDEEIEDDEDNDDDNSLTRSPRSTLAGKSSSSSSSIINKTNSSNSNMDENFSKRSSKNKRGILPKNATNVMKKWLFQHIVVS